MAAATPEKLTHDQLQRRMIKLARAEFPGIELHGSSDGCYLVGGKRAGRLMVLNGGGHGYPDISVDEPGRDGEAGAFVEVKPEGKFLSAPQKRRCGSLRSRGFVVVVCRKEREFVDFLREFLGPSWCASPSLPLTAREVRCDAVDQLAAQRARWQQPPPSSPAVHQDPPPAAPLTGWAAILAEAPSRPPPATPEKQEEEVSLTSQQSSPYWERTEEEEAARFACRDSIDDVAFGCGI